MGILLEIVIFLLMEQAQAMKIKVVQMSKYLTAFSVNSKSAEELFLDSRASAHLTSVESLLDNKCNSSQELFTACRKMPVKVSDVFYVPQLKVNLLSISKIVSKSNTVVFKSTSKNF